MSSNAIERRIVAAARPGPSSPAFLTRLASLSALVVETVSVALAIAHQDWPVLLLAHGLTTAALLGTALLIERNGGDSSQLQRVTFLAFVGGPIGAAAGILSDASLWRPQNAALADWYETISPSEDAAVTLVDQIIDGQLVSDESQLPRRFDKLLTSGSMAEKQAVLAYLALENGKPDVSNALRLALRSSDQRVRVQAAAVAAHVRDKARRPMGKEKIDAPRKSLQEFARDRLPPTHPGSR